MIVPVFALANAGVRFSGDAVSGLPSDPVALGVGLGLVVGKTVGVFAASLIAVKLGLGKLPSGTTWRHVFGLAMVAGVGFTVALFVTSIRFTDPVLADSAKIGILLGSGGAGVIGYLFLRAVPVAEAEAEAAVPDALGTKWIVRLKEAATAARQRLVVSGANRPSRATSLLTIERAAILQRVEVGRRRPGHTWPSLGPRGGPGQARTFIERGAVEDCLQAVIADGLGARPPRRQVAGEFGVGSVVGELAVLAPAPRAASVTAVEPTLLPRLRHGPFEELLDDCPEIARAVIATLARLLQATSEFTASGPGR